MFLSTKNTRKEIELLEIFSNTIDIFVSLENPMEKVNSQKDFCKNLYTVMKANKELGFPNKSYLQYN